MRRSVFRLAVIVAMTHGLPGCGIVPEAAPLISHEEKKALFAAVIRGVQCEIRNAVKEQMMKGPQRLDWLREWSSIISVKLTFDNKLFFNPGVSLITPMIPAHPNVAWGQTLTIGQQYSFGLGGQFEGDATRTEEVAFFYPFQGFNPPPDTRAENCYHFGALTITGNLELGDWLDDVLEPVRRCAFVGRPFRTDDEESNASEEEKHPQSCPPPANPINTLAHTVDFMITLGAGATPSWNLVRVAAPIASPLVGFTRKDISEVRITIGPSEKGPPESKLQAKPASGKGGKPQQAQLHPSQEMLFRNLSLSIGSDVRDALQQ